jgi:transcriptional repressor NrdR
MFCINCFNPSTQVANSRPHKKRPSVWRRRKCSKCHTTFTTYERPSLTENKKITLPNGNDDIFNLGKLVISISNAFTHQPEEAKYQSLWLAQTIEDTLSTEYPIITTDDIAAVTHQVLKQFDELAAVQYAARHRLIASTRKRGRPSLSERARRNGESPSR